MPAYSPTANCIWNAFRSSGKRHLVLTGSPDSEKRTQLSVLQSRLPPDIEGHWCRMNEMGDLEAGSPKYQNAFRELLEQKRILATVGKEEQPFIREICSRQDVFQVDFSHPFGNCSCVIMASGLGKRFGGNKLMVDFFGEPLICRILDATEGIFTKRVVVTRHETVAAFCRDRNISVIVHDRPHRSDTVRLGMEAVGDVAPCMFCPGDQPLLCRDTVAALVLAAKNQPDSIWRTCFENTPGSPVLFPQWAFPELMALPVGKGGGWVITHHPDQVSKLCVSDPYELMDADTPETLDMLLQRYQNKEREAILCSRYPKILNPMLRQEKMDF